MNNKAFSLIEVLIATLILSISILSITAAIKLFLSYQEKLDKYQLIYLSTLSLMDEISTTDLLRNPYREGYINGLKYIYKAKIIHKKTNKYNFSSPDLSNTVSTGNFYLYLFKINLKIGNKNFEFFQTQYKKIGDFKYE